VMPFAETGIAASVAIFGVLIAFAFRIPAWASGVMLASFALLHGYAHGAELPQGASAALYGAGFIMATALLQLAGFAFGNGFAGKAVRAVAAAIAAIGIYLVMAVA
jgi:urease accessory protein